MEDIFRNKKQSEPENIIPTLKKALAEAAFRSAASFHRGPLISPNRFEWVLYENELENDLCAALNLQKVKY